MIRDMRARLTNFEADLRAHREKVRGNCFSKKSIKERERERERDRQTERQRDRETERLRAYVCLHMHCVL